MANVTMDVLVDMLQVLPPSISVLVEGPHGIGKSALAKMLGTMLERRVIDLRLSQMTEGDFLGLPKLYDSEYDADGNIVKHGRTEFMPPDWLVQAMTEPVVLLLDELNRAIPEVMQCSFQLVYDRMVHGKAVHPDTRIIVCINATHHYQVNPMDPALRDRFLNVTLIPRLQDWLKWATNEGNIDASIVEFCRQSPDHWWHDPKNGLEPDKVYPTPRSWDMLNRALSVANLFEDPKNPIFRHIAAGMVGDEAGNAYYDFVKNYDRQVSAEQILDSYTDVKQRVQDGMTAEALATITEKLTHHCKGNEWTKKQIRNVYNFMQDMGNMELVFSLWTKISSIKNNEGAERNGILLHKEARKLIFKAMGQNFGAE